jgi:HK97 family phage prohead protease
MKTEYKLLDVETTEFKFDGETGEFEGYASVFNGVDSYGDTIMPGAYKATLKKRDRSVKMRWNHYGPVIGKYLEMFEDEKGLYVRGQLTPNHSVAKDVHASLKHGAIDGLSIGFFAKKADNKEEGGRILKEIELVEISVVEEPADLGARITNIKSELQKAERLADVEDILREAGFSKSEATTMVSRIKSIALGDLEQKKADSLGQFLTTFNVYSEQNHERRNQTGTGRSG